MINIIYLYQLYKRREIAGVKQINGDSNPIDAITKSKLLLAFKRLININQIKLKTVKWVKCITNKSINLKAQGRIREEERKEKEVHIQIF